MRISCNLPHYYFFKTWLTCYLSSLVSTMPASLKAMVQWTIREDWDGSCETVCSHVGGTCDQNSLDALGIAVSNDGMRARSLEQAYNAGGISCNIWNVNCAFSNCEVWGVPFVHLNHFSTNECWGGNAVARCNDRPNDGAHRRLCPCLVHEAFLPICSHGPVACTE